VQKTSKSEKTSFIALGGSGNRPLLPGNTQQSLVEHNKYINTDPNGQPTLTLNGEDTTFRQNTVENMNVTVAPEAKRLEIANNIFKADVIVAKVSEGAANEQLESVLSNIRGVFHDKWKSLPADTYKANDSLLTEFEASARAKPFDSAKTETLLQKVIDATKQQ
jgi:hypothetical protein